MFRSNTYITRTAKLLTEREREREMKLMLDFLIENSTKERFDGADMH